MALHSELDAGIETLISHILQGFMQVMHNSGLSRPQIHALLHIYHAGDCPVSEIGALGDSSPAAASQLVDRLVQQGWVQRSEDPQNRRIKRLRLTDQGLELIHQGMTSNHFLGQLLAALTDEQRATVHTALGYLAQAARQIHSHHQRKEKTDAQNT